MGKTIKAAILAGILSIALVAGASADGGGHIHVWVSPPTDDDGADIGGPEYDGWQQYEADDTGSYFFADNPQAYSLVPDAQDHPPAYASTGGTLPRELGELSCFVNYENEADEPRYIRVRLGEQPPGYDQAVWNSVGLVAGGINNDDDGDCVPDWADRD